MRKHFAMILSVAAMAWFACPAFAADASLFTSVSYDANNDGAVDLPGQLYVPTGYSSSSSSGSPLVIFLHGVGESGTNNTSQIGYNINNLITGAASNNFLVYAPQTKSAWSTTDISNLMNVVAELSQTYNIDTSRIYVTGLSMGGAGTWETTSLYADVLAAEVPICGALKYVSYDELAAAQNGDMAGEPIWTFHALNDSTVPVAQTRNMVNAILTSNGETTWTFTDDHTGTVYYESSAGDVRYTEYATGGHGIWTTAYAQSSLYTWLLSQSTELHQLQDGEMVLFDIGNTATTTDSQGRTWNNTTADSQSSLHVTSSFAKMTDGERTGVSLAVVSGFTGVSSNGKTTGTTYDSSVAKDGWYTSSEGVLELTGLTPGGEYKIVIFGSTTDASGVVTRYIIGDESVDLTTYNNISDTAIFDCVTADEDGYLYITVTAGDGYTYGYISGLEVTAVPEPTTMALLAIGGIGALVRRRRK